MLVIAKAPVPGQVKTRLCPPLSHDEAAQLASAALIDTLTVAAGAASRLGEHRPMLALSGNLAQAARREELGGLLTGFEVISQRGNGLGERLAAAHDDVARAHPTSAVVQIGMDTPQVTVEHLMRAAAALATADGALGAAQDGGWWVLALREPRRAAVLRTVPTSRPDTGPRTLDALRRRGVSTAELPRLRDVDTWEDALSVAELVPGSSFARALARLRSVAQDRDAPAARPEPSPGSRR